MNEKDLELEEFSLEEIMREFGDDPELSGKEEPAAAPMGDTQDLMETISQISRTEESAEPQPAEEADATEETETDAAEEKATAEAVKPEEKEEPAEATEASEKPEESPVNGDTIRFDMPTDGMEQLELDDTVRLDDLSKITGTAPSFASKLEDKTERIGSVWDEENDDDGHVEIPVPAPIVFRPKQRLRELKRDLIAGPEKRYYELSE